MNRGSRRMTAAAVAVGLVFVTSGAAMAGGDVEKRGNCTKRSDWRLKVKPDDGRLEVEAEVDTPKTGRKWQWKILHDGDVSAHGRARTAGGGSFKVERRLIDAQGADAIGWRAVNKKTHEKCRGSLTI